MSEPIDGLLRASAGLRKSIFGMSLAVALMATMPASAGVIHHSKVHTNATVEIKKADPWSGYWTYALNHHILKLTGPGVHVSVALNADGTLPTSPFVQYMTWREGLSAKRFDSFHPQLARVLNQAVTTPTTNPAIPPETVIPPTGGTPILPPDYTPITNPETLIPPHIPEPSTGLIALGLIAAVGFRRRWTKLRT